MTTGKDETMRYTICVALLLGSPLALADAHMADTGPVMETFRCTFHDGKGPDDLWKAAAFFNEQVDKIDSEALDSYFAAVLTPLRASMDGDFGWIGYWPNLNTMARGLTAFSGSEAGQAAESRFADLSDCEGNVWLREPLISNYPDDDATPESDAVELYLCTLNEGATMDAAAAAEQGYVDAHADAPIALDRWTPYLANTPYDLVYLVAHEDLTAFADLNTKWQTSEAGAANNAQFGEVMDCESGLFSGRVIREGNVD